MYKELNKLRAVHGSYDDLLSGTGAMATTDFSQADMGDNPAVNLATGRLRYSFDDLSVGYGNFAVNVGHVYLSQHFSAFVNKFPELSSGWKLNVAQYIVFNSSSSSLTPYALYMDEAGEVHRFICISHSLRGGFYRDERNAKITLSEYVGNTFDSFYIEDGVGNRIYFDRYGRITRKISCHDSAMVKSYIYDDNHRLITVYDSRNYNRHSGQANPRIEFTYDDDNRLISATAYAGKILSSVTYGYDSNGRLTQVDRVAYNRKNRQCLVTPSLGFEYTNRLLTQATDLETKSAYRFTYADDKISKVEQGVIGSDSVGTGAADADGNSLAYCGNGLYCGALTKTEFVRKASNSYDYYYDGGDTRIASETDVTNQNNIKLAYFINRDACVTSTFEKVDSNLKTLDKQGAKRISGLVGSDIGATEINGIKRYSASGTLSVLENAAKEVTRNDREQGLRTFNYSFWLKLPQNGEFMQAKATYKFTSGAEQTSTVFIDGKAVNAWQAVSLPLYAPLRNDDDTKTDTLSYLTVQLLNNNQPYTGAYEFSEIGIAPAPISRMLLCCADGYTLPLTDVTSVTLGANVYNVSEDMYFTESDVVATYTNRYKNGGANFTVIYNNGTARKIASSIQFSSDYAATIDNAAPFVIQLNMTDGKTQVTSKYIYNAQSMVITTEGKHENTSSSASVEIDYLGKTLKETDEYGVSKQYYYNDYGDVTRMQVVGSDGVVGSTVAYSYDGKGRLIGSHDGLTGQKVAYTEYDQVGTVTKCKVVDDSLQETPHKTENTYGVFRDNALAVTEYDGGEQQARNEVTYEQGRIRTVTDGTRKYGVKYNLANGVVDYTRFELQNKERLVQRDSVPEVSGSDICQKHRSEFFEGDAVKDTLTTEVTKYGKVNAVAYKSGTNAETRSYYTYDNPTESGFTAVATKLVDGESGTTTEYSYDADGNLTEWKQYENAPSNQQQFALSVKQLYANSTEYDFDRDDIYKLKFTTGLEYDTDKLINPRLAKITNSTFPLFNQHYEYDTLGRIIGKDNVNHSRYMYGYTTQGGVALLTSNEFKNYYDKDAYNFSLPRVHLTEQLSYTDQGDLSNVTQSYSWTSFKDYNISQNIKCNWQSAYEYDNLHRLTKETNTAFNIQRQYSYDNNGRMQSVVDKNGITKSYTYDIYGRLSSIAQGSGYSPLGYDNYGNCTSYNGIKYSYKRGNLLTSVDEYDIGWTANVAKYEYDVNGVRSKKVVGVVTTKYYYDGNKILGEDRTGTQGGDKHFRYAYDNDGITGMVYQGSPYLYVKDGQGNVAMLLYHDGRVAARYVYDAWGNCKVYDENNNSDTDANSVGNLNPIRWKGHYYDVETGLYYINGRFYNPTIGIFINAKSLPDTLRLTFLLRNLDRNSILYDNVNKLSRNFYTVQPTVELFADPTYQSTNSKQWWQWLIGGILAAVSFVIAGVTGNWPLAIATTLVCASIGAGSGALIAQHEGQNVAQGALNGMITGIIMGNSSFAGAQLWAQGGITNIIKGVAVSFLGGAVAGAYSESTNQINNNGKIVNKKSILITAVEYGGINILATVFGVITQEVTGIMAIGGIYIFDLVTSAISVAIDLLRNM